MKIALTTTDLKPNLSLVSRDGTKLAGRQWPAADPKAVVAFVHGYADHSGRYEHVARFLNEAGISVLAIDLRGHGASAGARGFIRSFDDYLDDATALLDAAKAEASKTGQAVPLFLVGHSMGGLVALCHALKRGGAYRGVAVSSPFLGVGVPVPAWKASLGRIMSRIYPGLAMPSGIDPADLSHEPEVGRAYAADPLVFSTATARWFTEALDAMADLKLRAPHMQTPCLILQAGEDRLCDPKASGPLHEALGAADKTLIQYPGFYHEIFNETERARPLSDLLGWIKARIE